MKKYAILLGLLMAGCATGGSPKITMIDENTAIISLSQVGLGFDDTATTKKLFVAAGEATKKRGFRYFVMTPQSTDQAHVSKYIQTQSMETAIWMTNDLNGIPADVKVWDSESVLAAK